MKESRDDERRVGPIKAGRTSYGHGGVGLDEQLAAARGFCLPSLPRVRV